MIVVQMVKSAGTTTTRGASTRNAKTTSRTDGSSSTDAKPAPTSHLLLHRQQHTRVIGSGTPAASNMGQLHG